MTERITHEQYNPQQTFVNPSCASNNGFLNIAKSNSCVDAVKPLLGPSLENRIYSILKEFVCKSNSPNAKRFPRVKKWLDVVTAWADCLDSSYKDMDVRKEMIKHAIEYLVKDGLVTQFADPILNKGQNKEDPDSFANEQIALKSMNVLRYINEKDYWLCQDCVSSTTVEPRISPQVCQSRKETSSSDLDVEIGSISQDSTLYCTCRTASVHRPSCGQTIENRKLSPGNLNCRNFELIFEPDKNALNHRKETLHAFNNPSNIYSLRTENVKNCDTKRDCDCNTEIVSKRFVQTQTSRRDLTFTFNPNRKTLNRPKEISNTYNNPKPYPRRGNLKESNVTTTCECNTKNDQNTLNCTKEVPYALNDFKSYPKRGNLKQSDVAPVCDCNKKVNNKKFVQIQTSCQDIITFEPNENTLKCTKGTIATLDDPKSYPRNGNLKQSDIVTICECNEKLDSKKFVQTQTSYQDTSFVFEPSKSSFLNAPKATSNISDNPEPYSREGNVKKSDIITVNLKCDQNIFPKNSKLKVYVHKTTSTNVSKLRDPPKLSNLSLPCKSSQLIVRLFEADPSLSDSCLVLMRKKFEKEISNACSCMNDILKRLDKSMINNSCLNCEIRPGRVDLNLVCRDGGISKFRWFLARVPTCSNVHKRDSCHRNRENCENSQNRCATECSRDFPVDSSYCRDTTKRGEGFEEQRVAFYSVCSNHSLTEDKQIWTLKNEIGKKETGEEVNFMWSNKREKQMDTAFSSHSLSLQKNRENSVVSVEADGNDKDNNSREIGRICNRENELTFLDGGREKMAMEECRRTEKIVDLHGKKEMYTDREIGNYERFIIEDSDNKTIIELCNCKCNYSSDSLQEDVLREDNSPTGGCNPEQCFCHVFCSSNRLDNDKRNEKENAYITRSQVENFEVENKKIDCFRHSEEDNPGLQAFVLQNTKEYASNVVYCSDTLLTKNMSIFEAEERDSKRKEITFRSKNSILKAENNCELGAGIFYREEKKEGSLKAREKYSEDSICAAPPNSTDVSCDTKCSCCGEDLLDPSFDTENINIEDKNSGKSNKAVPDLKIHEELDLIATENATLKDTILEGVNDSAISQSVKFRMVSNAAVNDSVYRSGIISTHDQFSSTVNVDPRNFLCKCLKNSEQNSVECDCNKENAVNSSPEASKFFSGENSSITESLFVFCKGSNAKLPTSTSNSSSDEESRINKTFPTRSREANKKFGSSCRLQNPPIIPRPCHRKSIRSTACAPSCSTKNLSRINSTKRNSKYRNKGKDSNPMDSRYRDPRLRQGSMISGSLCNSFPAIDRIKYLIRKKLRKLLLEERDKGTNTSKTFLRNDRYLVSISSGKLKGGRTIRESCSAGSSIRCPFTTRNQYEAGGAPGKTFTEGCKNMFGDIIKAKNQKDFRDTIKERYEKIIHSNDVLKKLRTIEVSKSLNRKCDSKSTDTRDLIEKRERISENRRSKLRKNRNKEKFSINSFSNNRNQKNRESLMTLNSGRIISAEGHGDHFLNRKPYHGKIDNSKETNAKFIIYSPLNNSNQKNRINITSSNSGKTISFEEEMGDRFLNRKSYHPKSHSLKKNSKGRNFSVDSNVTKSYFRRNYYKPDSREISSQSKENGEGMDIENRIYREKLKSFEKRLFKLEKKHEEDNNLTSFLGDYDKHINELDADFRLKLLQYVALCRSVKNTLIKRLQTDDVYEVSSSLVEQKG